MIPDGAHHLDLRYSNDLDTPSVRTARALEVKYFREWIHQAKNDSWNRINPLMSCNRDIHIVEDCIALICMTLFFTGCFLRRYAKVCPCSVF